MPHSQYPNSIKSGMKLFLMVRSSSIVQIIPSISFQAKDVARRRCDPQVASQQLAVLGTVRNEEFHCWGGSEGGSAAAGSDGVQRRGVCGGSVDGEGQPHPLEETSEEQDPLGEDCFPAAQCSARCYTISASFFGVWKDWTHCTYSSVNGIPK